MQDQVETGASHRRRAMPKRPEAYILYRAERSRTREAQTRLMPHPGGHHVQGRVRIGREAREREYRRRHRHGHHAQIRLGGRQAVLRHVCAESGALPRRISTGDIHIHDLDFLTLTTTCCQIDTDKLFKGGFCTGHGFLREPQRHRQLCGAGLHRHSVQPERPARRPEHPQL